jgi:hypothetical protein
MKCWSWCLVVVAVAVLAGCGSTHQQSNPPAASTTTTASSPASTSPPVTTPTTTASVPTTGAPTVGPSLCSTSQLAASLGAANGTAGTTYYPLALRNASAARCYVQGYPGVSFVAGADGHQVGAPATRSQGATARVVLAPGQVADATLGIHDASAFTQPPCDQTPVLGLRIYPPDQTTALFVPHRDTGCANAAVATLLIGPLTAAA